MQIDGFHYQDGQLFCENVDVGEIAAEIGTPFYLYSHEILENRAQAFQSAFTKSSALICYALKANSNRAILTTLAHAGLGADVVSGGELTQAIRAGINARDIVFAGVGKTTDEIQLGLKNGIRAFNVESLPELENIAKEAARMGHEAPVSFRVNPNIDPKTHPYISTGLKEHKFGVSFEVGRKGYHLVQQHKYLNPVGIHAHLGSQISGVQPFEEMMAKLSEFVGELAGQGIELGFIDVGGGVGIPYREHEECIAIQEYAKAVEKGMDNLDLEPLPTIIAEPGRAISGPAGILVSEITYVKEKKDKKFLILDAGMNDFIRPSLYEAWHEILPLKERCCGDVGLVDVVGPVCESADFFAQDRKIPDLSAGERLAIKDAGAYGYSMSSNYNSRPRPAEVMVKGSEFDEIRKRETMEDLLQDETLPGFLKE